MLPASLTVLCSIKAAASAAVAGGALAPNAADRVVDTFTQRMLGYT